MDCSSASDCPERLDGMAWVHSIGRRRLRTFYLVKAFHHFRIALLPCMFAMAAVVCERHVAPLYDNLPSDISKAPAFETSGLVHALSLSIRRAIASCGRHRSCFRVYR
jgi:hypothetical protein